MTPSPHRTATVRMGARILMFGFTYEAAALHAWPLAAVLVATYCTSAGMWDWLTDRQIAGLERKATGADTCRTGWAGAVADLRAVQAHLQVVREHARVMAGADLDERAS